MLPTFEFNNKKLSDFGAVIEEAPHYVLSVREFEFTSIPQKSGDFITDKKRFKNRTVSYKISSIPPWCDYDEQKFVYRLSAWLLTSYEYKILKDTYNTNYYQRAVCTGITNVAVDAKGAVSATINFNCDPFLYSKSGLTEIEVNSNNYTITNREKWDAEPIIKVNGNGVFTVTVNTDVIEITLDGTEITIDKPNEDVYYTSTGISCNDKIDAVRLPILKPGANEITYSTGSGTGFTMTIIPNWRRL